MKQSSRLTRQMAEAQERHAHQVKLAPTTPSKVAPIGQGFRAWQSRFEAEDELAQLRDSLRRAAEAFEWYRRTTGKAYDEVDWSEYLAQWLISNTTVHF